MDRQQGDPPGSTLGGATDRVLGTNTSGASAQQRDGRRSKPAGTALERAAGAQPAPRRYPDAPGLRGAGMGSRGRAARA
ncbi:hypothetical protein [Neoroseomonas alkaliterrae]|uniref:hypothetical protein n=1 Tax=Neoroseomonas alkaliterrae TaxID=1452450 RepID=UPI00161843C0|nr:hypothetical protein [Neoroseomonas alkaliterrae]